MSSYELIESDEKHSVSTDVVEIATTRQAQEVQAMIILSKKFPRDMKDATIRILGHCRRKSLAEIALYKYPKGGKYVRGPSIRLAECMAQCWGNIDYGLIELASSATESHIMAYAWDTETNTRSTKIFTVRHVRATKQDGTYALSDPREVYENIANFGMRRVRQAILALIPRDIQDQAVSECLATMHPGEKELPEEIKKIVEAFAKFGITAAQLERNRGHNLASFDGSDVVELRSIWMSLRDDMSSPEDWFDVPQETVKPGESKTAKIGEEMKQKKAKKVKPAPIADEVAKQVLHSAPDVEVVATPTPEGVFPKSPAAAMSDVQIGIAHIMLRDYVQRLAECKDEGEVRQAWSAMVFDNKDVLPADIFAYGGTLRDQKIASLKPY